VVAMNNVLKFFSIFLIIFTIKSFKFLLGIFTLFIVIILVFLIKLIGFYYYPSIEDHERSQEIHFLVDTFGAKPILNCMILKNCVELDQLKYDYQQSQVLQYQLQNPIENEPIAESEPQLITQQSPPVIEKPTENKSAYHKNVICDNNGTCKTIYSK
jgi:hypothetical protein